jgi:hypothetical protein
VIEDIENVLLKLKQSEEFMKAIEEHYYDPT